MLNGGSYHFHDECIASHHTRAFKHLGYLADTCYGTNAALSSREAHPNDRRHRKPYLGEIDFCMIASDYACFFQFAHPFADCGGRKAHSLPKLTVGETCLLL